MNCPNYRIIVIDHPLGDINERQITERAQVVSDALLDTFREAGA
jgi:hypothetical protein